MSKQTKDEIRRVAASAAGLPTTGFFVEFDRGACFVNHPDSMRWSPETREAIKRAVEAFTGGQASVT